MQSLLQLIEFPPLDTDPTDAENVIIDLADYVLEKRHVERQEIGTFIHIGQIVVFIRPDEDISQICARYREQVERKKDWMERRQGGDRRLFMRIDDQERRSA